MCKVCNVNELQAPTSRDSVVVRRKRKLANYLQPVKKSK